VDNGTRITVEIGDLPVGHYVTVGHYVDPDQWVPPTVDEEYPELSPGEREGLPVTGVEMVRGTAA
jgi:hypothetical protein